MRRDITCATVRLWLQAPHELSTSDTSLLTEHLLECGVCSAFRSRQEQLDAALTGSLQALPAPSVARQVRGQLEMRASHRSRRRMSWRVPSTWQLVPLALAAMLFALLFPQALPDGGTLSPARAAWHLVRPDVGFPLAVDPSRPNHLLAGAFGQVYESWTGEGPWRRLAALPPHLVIRALAIDAANPQRYLVATKHSIFLSPNRGRRWIAATGSLPGAENMFLTQDVRAPATFYVGPSILWKSMDRGASWAPAGRGFVFAPDGIQAMQVSPHGTLLAAIWHGGVAVSNNGGRTWQRRARGLAPNVMDVAAGQRDTLWAATDRGVYVSADTGLHWRHSRLQARFLTTSLLVRNRVLLAGGDHALYRSPDGGAHWSLAMTGLPLDPYISGLSADPFHPQRIYASLNSDGIFRSDDGGRHWRAVDNGLPLTSTAQPTPYILFRRAGSLWLSDVAGTDPGVLTVQHDVKLAALSADQAAIAYAAGEAGRWGVYVLAAGGSAPRTLLHGRGRLPSALLWSPTSSLLTIVRRSRVTVTDLTRATTWALPPGARVLAWTPDGHSLLTWDAATHQVMTRIPQTGVAEGVPRGHYLSAPVVAPDASHVAVRVGDSTALGELGHSLRTISASRGCRPVAWSGDSTRLLAACRHTLLELSPTGVVLERAHLPAPVRWLPGGHDLLFFRHGALSVWSPSGARELIPQADPVSATH